MMLESEVIAFADKYVDRHDREPIPGEGRIKFSSDELYLRQMRGRNERRKKKLKQIQEDLFSS